MTPNRLVRSLFPSRLRATNATTITTSRIAAPSTVGCRDPHSCLNSNCRCFAQVNDIEPWNRDVWFTSSAPRYTSPDQKGDHKPPDERTVKLGRTVRKLHERLPTLLKEPLPSDILSPSISLHLFPSTHPHLPTVSGRIAYIAALWTAPVAWGRMPLIGNVKLDILAERMVQHGGTAVPLGQREEKLIVKWKTCGKTSHRDGTGGIYRGMGLAAKDPVEKIRGFIAGTKSGDRDARARDEPEEFRGIFIFEFDEEGRIRKHTIEHTEEGGDHDRMTRVVSVTDWLLGQFNGKRKHEEPALALCEERPNGGSIHLMDRRYRR
ncbi:hypothetical protein CB0940_02573 [Cercospora beticola]|uniref:Uncharacterized protein n=1 Tax=Cercospora beticola TaxID=122368 RepID=A0A2G5I5D1_CERBT|nr:hypothetical protein CB0940_02573 [Cercospora beticola]PIA99971.1 hypothetical protein CB0940_02573 [Cercospora beticola]WPA99714.1 hypothetical protein RHO25_004333 [Cercospora beticola]CAK1362138.1 unnamed protein product [Cercospora beticola]